jgi:cytochrome c peroxidase
MIVIRPGTGLGSVTAVWLALSACSSEAAGPEAASEAAWLDVPADFPPLPSPPDNQLTRERAALGKRLFFDTRLSRTDDISCGSCHLQAAAFSDPTRVSSGVEGRVGSRNAPALINAAWSRSFFWDGGVPSLELQAIAPIQNELEMDSTLEAVAVRLSGDEALRAEFELAYGEGPSEFTISRALASFVRTLVSGQSRYDRFQRGDSSALDAAEQRGLAIFNGEAGECFHCHTGFNFAIDEFRNNGVAPDDPDLGRATITHRPFDEGKFKIPTLRNVAVTAPYMHDGSLSTLEEVIERYARGGLGHPNTDPLIQPLALDADEKRDLARFLESLTDDTFLGDARFAP